MNILFITYQGGVAGSTSSIAYLAKGLANLNHQVYVGCPKDRLLYGMFDGSNAKPIAMDFKGKIDLKNIKQIKAIVTKYKIDIINAQSSYDRYSSVFARWLFHLPVKVVHTRRQMPLSIGGFFQNIVYERGTDGIVAVSQKVKDAITKLGISDKHITVIRNGFPSDKFDLVNNQLTQQFRDKWEIKPNEMVIGCISRKKQQIQILKALKHLKNPVKVIFIGISNNEEYQSVTASYTVPHSIIYAGTLTQQECMSCYPLFTIDILASTIEGFSQALLEAMAIGVPVIATAAGGNEELIRDGENGFIFENENILALSDKIKLLLENIGLREKFSVAGKESAQLFSIQNTVQNYEKYFNGLLGKQ